MWWLTQPWQVLARETVLVALLVVAALVVGVQVWRFFRARAEERAQRQPLALLALQARLRNLAHEIRELESSGGFARAHHLRAAQAAYDAVLAEACTLLGDAGPVLGQPVEGAEADPLPELSALLAEDAIRLNRELALSERGWHW